MTKIKRGKKLKNSEQPCLAELADKFVCYQRSVQEPDHEVHVFDQVYREAFKAKPLTLREDFCGTFAVSCEWAKSDKNRQAVGFDICPETLAWGVEHNLGKLKAKVAKRVEVHEQDARSRTAMNVDVLAAQNFSFWCFKTREEVLNYFRMAYENLKEKGVMVMDMMGGKECYASDVTDKRTIVKGKNGFKYHWEQASFNPVSADCSFYIHFKFADGSMIEKAFEYHWRFWTIPEVREMLAEAGFRLSKVYWDVADEEEDADWQAVDDAPNDDSWLCYVVGVR